MIKLGMLMDPIEHIKRTKDTSFAMLLEAQKRHYENYYIQPENIWLQDGEVWGKMQRIFLQDTTTDWYQLDCPFTQPLQQLDVLLMRKDPPFNMDYIYLTYLLEHAQKQGVLVINDPQALRDANEKLFTLQFPQCFPRTLVSANIEQLKNFIFEEKKAIVKPLHSMGGQSVFQARSDDPNLSVILETITDCGKRIVMAQRYISEIQYGDKRILMIDGKPIPYALARLPKSGDFRGNLAAGGLGKGQALSERDYWICTQVGHVLREKGLIFVGLDVIGDFLTEINVTSPTGARELDKIFHLNICGDFMDVVEEKLCKK